MEWLNYHHLLYFWTVAREGTIARASEELRLAQPTISGQIRLLEESLGEKLFRRSGRRLVLTDVGQVVFRYADDIFSLGRELRDSLRGLPTGRRLKFVVGIADVLPKLIAYRLLGPALQLPSGIQVVCREDKPQRLLASLAVHELDLVLSDAPIGPEAHVRAFSHLLGECGVTFFSATKHVRQYRRNFPHCLESLPFLAPGSHTTLRRSMDLWFQKRQLRPRISAEFDDSALMKVFGQAGLGAFAAPRVIEKEITKQYSVGVIARVDEIRERFYAISVERRLQHPAVVAISDAARHQLFMHS